MYFRVQRSTFLRFMYWLQQLEPQMEREEIESHASHFTLVWLRDLGLLGPTLPNSMGLGHLK